MSKWKIRFQIAGITLILLALVALGVLWDLPIVKMRYNYWFGN